MAFHTGIYRHSQPNEALFNGQLLYSHGAVTVRDVRGLYNMYLNGHSIAQLINGEDGLRTYHKGDFADWVAKVRAKDETKVGTLRELAEEIEQDCKWQEGLWKSHDDALTGGKGGGMKFRVYVGQVNQDYVEVTAKDMEEAEERGYRKWRRTVGHSRVTLVEEIAGGKGKE